MTGGSLFSGIGGFELGLLRSGLITEVKWQVEIDGFCRQILERHFPETKRYGDIRECGQHNLEPVDVIFGGFPCQPFSVAGKRQGAEDDRYLWPEMVRIIAEIRPTLVIGENVSGIVNMALDQVLSDLEAEGYETATFVIPACAVNAPHRRDRVWIVGYSKNSRCEWWRQKQVGTGRSLADGFTGTDSHAPEANERKSRPRNESKPRVTPHEKLSQNDTNAPDAEITERKCAGVARTGWDGFTDQDTNAFDSHIQRLQGKPNNIGGKGAQSHDKQFMRCDRGWEENWLEVATRFCGMDARVSDRVDRLKALGNAVVPQVAEAIGTIIKEWLDDNAVD